MALLASLEEPNFTEGQERETGKDGWCGGAAKQEASKLPNRDSQSSRICAK